jgi:hypothetical protein
MALKAFCLLYVNFTRLIGAVASANDDDEVDAALFKLSTNEIWR